MAARVIDVFSTEQEAKVHAEKLRAGNQHTSVFVGLRSDGITVTDHTVNPPNVVFDKDGSPDLYIVQADAKV